MFWVFSYNHVKMTPQIVSEYCSIQNYYPRKIIFSKLIRRGVIYYAGNSLPQIIFAELPMRGSSVSHYVDRLFWGYKKLLKKSNGNYFSLWGGNSRITPQKRF